LQKVLQEITRLGAKLVAVSPQTPDESLSTADKNALAFPVLSDAGSATAKSFGIAYDLAEGLRPIYARFGHALPDKNGDESWILRYQPPTRSIRMARSRWRSSMWITAIAWSRLRS
jgi:hypothetical protein